jgi:hypothetical protein
MSNEDTIPAGHADFENTLTPEQAEEFDRLAARLAAAPKPPTRQELIQEGLVVLSGINAYFARLNSVRFQGPAVHAHTHDAHNVRRSMTCLLGELTAESDFNFRKN